LFLEIARLTVRGLVRAHNAGLDANGVRNLVTAVSEALTNAVHHGGSCGVLELRHGC
jgi:anti-sigma regulatory factor (Ser/Thr protein kinase)